MSSIVRKGIYTFAVYQFDKPSIKNKVDVEILKETTKSFYIKLKGFTANRGPNEEIWVSKKFVKEILPPEPPQEDKPVKEYWWNKD